MTTPPNTELKSAEELDKEWKQKVDDWIHAEPPETQQELNAEFYSWLRSIQHNAMLHAAEIAGDGTPNTTVENDREIKQAILTRAEQILKGEK